METGLPGFILVSAFILGLGTIPGLAMIRILDPGADRLRQVMLLPAASLLVMFGLAGWLVVIRGVHSFGHLMLAVLLVNGLAATIGWQRETVRVRRLSAWERLEAIADAAEAEGVSVVLESDIAAEQAHASLVASGRPKWLPLALAISALVCLTPLLLFDRPLGVDWLGFATLSHRLAETGALTLPAPNVGRWTYPPAFPALAAFMEQISGLPPQDCIHILGQLSLFAVLWGVAGAADRWGAAAPTLLALCLAPALFAKAFDSGYPTVASQLGLVLGLLVLVKPPRERRKRMDLLFAFGVAFVGVIHPTGSLYLGTLLIAWLGAHRWSAARDRAQTARLAILSAAILGFAVVLVMGAFAPRMLDTPVWAEYGWQGGLPLLVFNGPVLLALAGWTLWRFNAAFEVWLLGLWLGLQWSLTWIHLFDGLVGISLFSLLSYMLYSMALHAFHVPLAVLGGIGLARLPRLTARIRELRLGEETEMDAGIRIELTVPAAAERRPVRAMMAIAVLAMLISHTVMIELAKHPEVEAQTPGDRALRGAIGALPEGSILYTETAHWGVLYQIDPDIGQTSFPSLGLLTVEKRIQWEAERAIVRDDLDAIQSLGITHAATSPRGQMGHVLAESMHWAILAEADGSRLWRFEADPTISSRATSVHAFPAEQDCGEGCVWRTDPWLVTDTHHLGIRPDATAWLQAGGHWAVESIELPRGHRDAFVSVGIVVTVTAEAHIAFESCDTECSTWSDSVGPGIHHLRVVHRTDLSGRLNLSLHVEVEDRSWIDPAGLSGRSDRIVENGGVWVHWAEVRGR